MVELNESAFNCADDYEVSYIFLEVIASGDYEFLGGFENQTVS